MFNWLRRIFSPSSERVLTKRSLTDDEFRDLKNKREKKLNQILEKISKQGFESLSNSEKNFLENMKKL
jgi:hypothetical protein